MEGGKGLGCLEEPWQEWWSQGEGVCGVGLTPPPNDSETDGPRVTHVRV